MKTEVKNANRESAKQHARCAYALTMLLVLFGKMPDFTGDDTQGRNILDVKRWMDKAAPDILAKDLSAAAARRFDSKGAELWTLLQKLLRERDTGFRTCWDAAFYAVALLVRDCLSVCPKWAHGVNWTWLRKSADAYSDTSEEGREEVAEMGTDIYTALCWND